MPPSKTLAIVVDKNGTLGDGSAMTRDAEADQQRPELIVEQLGVSRRLDASRLRHGGRHVQQCQTDARPQSDPNTAPAHGISQPSPACDRSITNQRAPAVLSSVSGPRTQRIVAFLCQSSGSWGYRAASAAVMALLPRMVKWTQPPQRGQRPTNPTSLHQARTRGSRTARP